MDDLTTSSDYCSAGRRPGGWMFLLEAAQDLRTTGAVVPSGRALARALAEPVPTRGSRPLTVLEAGAGTGAVTSALLRQLAPGSRLDIVEANPRFADRLRHLVQPYARPGGEPGQVRVHQSYVQELEPDCRYDIIVSGLPLTNFTPERVATIMTRYLDLLAPGGTLTYFAYLGTRRARTLFSPRAEADRHRAVDELMTEYQRRHGLGRRIVWANLPPATVWQLQRFAGTPELPIATPAATAAGR